MVLGFETNRLSDIAMHEYMTRMAGKIKDLIFIGF